MAEFIKQIGGFDQYAANVKRRIDVLSDIAEAKTVYDYNEEGEVTGSKNYPNLDVRVENLEKAVGIDATSTEETTTLIQQLQTSLSAVQNNVNVLADLPSRVATLESRYTNINTRVTALENWKVNVDELLTFIQDGTINFEEIVDRIKTVEERLGIDYEASKIDDFFEFDLSKNIMPAETITKSNIFELSGNDITISASTDISSETANPRFAIDANGDVMPMAA